MQGQKLRIEHVKESDSGLYVCRADNRAGQAETTAQITVKDFRERLPPRLIHTPYNIDAPKGSTIEIPCRADGEPTPVIVWRKDGKVLEEDKSHRKISPGGSLYVHNVTFDDAGLYECSAVNDYGKITANGVLTVKGERIYFRFFFFIFRPYSKYIYFYVFSFFFLRGDSYQPRR